MSGEIIDLHAWFNDPAGRYLLDWEQSQMDGAVADIFGYHALQLGLAQLRALRANRMPDQWLALAEGEVLQGISLSCDFDALPFSANTLDLIVLPHTLEFCPDPHAALREVERVLVPEGRVVITGFNPISLWGLRQQRSIFFRQLGLGRRFLPVHGSLIATWRMQDWLRLLSFEIEEVSFGCFRPSMESDSWLERFAWMDRLGERWWPILGASYFMVAVKRVRGMRLLGPAWKKRAVAGGSQISVANRLSGSSGKTKKEQS